MEDVYYVSSSLTFFFFKNKYYKIYIYTLFGEKENKIKLGSQNG